MNAKDVLNEICFYKFEQDWFEFKENCDNEDEIGECISALSNSAAYCGRNYAYMVWGISTKNHISVGTSFDYDKNVRHGESLKYYLESKLSDNVCIDFKEEYYKGKRIVILIISAAKTIPVDWDGKRYIKVDSKSEQLSKFPEKEVILFETLTEGLPTIENTPSKYQDLTFSKKSLFAHGG